MHTAADADQMIDTTHDEPRKVTVPHGLSGVLFTVTIATNPSRMYLNKD